MIRGEGGEIMPMEKNRLKKANYSKGQDAKLWVYSLSPLDKTAKLLTFNIT